MKVRYRGCDSFCRNLIFLFGGELMNRGVRYFLFLLVAGGGSFLLVGRLAYPVLLSYPRLAQTMARFAYTEVTLMIFCTLFLWLFAIQWEMRKLSVVYVYLSASVYCFLLFVVLFTKAPSYHAVQLNPLRFFLWSEQSIREAVLNIGYFLPLGMMYAVKATKREFLLIAGSTILGIETLQYLFYLGTFDTSDIVLNLCGCWGGYLLYQKFHPRFVNNYQT